MSEPDGGDKPRCCGTVPGSFKGQPVGNACQLCDQPPAAEFYWRNDPDTQVRLAASVERHERTGSWLPGQPEPLRRPDGRIVPGAWTTG